MTGPNNPTGELADFTDLIERTTLLHNTAEWQVRYAELAGVLGEPKFTDGRSWAAFAELSLGDETELPPWCLLARTRDLAALGTRARAAGWAVGAAIQGGHEIRTVLTAPSGLVVVAYTPASS